MNKAQIIDKIKAIIPENTNRDSILDSMYDCFSVDEIKSFYEHIKNEYEIDEDSDIDIYGEEDN